MLRIIYDWLIVPPAMLFAGIYFCATILLAIAIPAGAGWLTFLMLSSRSYRVAVAAGWVFGLYVGLASFTALELLPPMLFRYLKGD